MNFLIPSSYLIQTQSSQPSTIDWGMIGTLISLVALIAAIIIGIFQIKLAERPKKSIKCMTVSKASLVKFDDRFKDQLQVCFQGKDIKDATSIILRVHNSGKLAITPNDFIRPISFIFASSSEIINAEILKVKPTNLGAKLLVVKNGIELQPLLMNSGDTIEISTIISSFNNNLTVDGRIIDVKTIKLEEEFKTDNDKQITLTSIQTILIMLAASTSSISFLRIIISESEKATR
jgi:hypothetical protein